MTAISLRDKIVELEDRLKLALKHEAWQTNEINGLRQKLIDQNEIIGHLDFDKAWLKNIITHLVMHE